jgi:hypothetical protein
MVVPNVLLHLRLDDIGVIGVPTTARFASPSVCYNSFNILTFIGYFNISTLVHKIMVSASFFDEWELHRLIFTCLRAPGLLCIQ